MKQDIDLGSAYREQWLALLDRNGVRRPAALQVIAVPGIVAQLTKGEPSGSLDLDESPGNVLMVNLSPVQALQQVRNQRSFVSDLLHWDMTLMPMGTRSKWSWNSTCDRFDLVVSEDALGEEHRIDTVDRFLFRDRELGNICRKLCREISLRGSADRLYIETLAIDMASMLLRRYSTASARAGHEGISGTRSRRWSKTLSRLHPHRSTVKHRMLNGVSRAEEQRIICGFRFAVSSQIIAWNRVAKHSQIQFRFIHRAYHGAVALAEVVGWTVSRL